MKCFDGMLDAMLDGMLDGMLRRNASTEYFDGMLLWMGMFDGEQR